MQRAGELVEIKTFTGKKTLMNAVALVLHTLLYGARAIYLCVLHCSTVGGEGMNKMRVGVVKDYQIMITFPFKKFAERFYFKKNIYVIFAAAMAAAFLIVS